MLINHIQFMMLPWILTESPETLSNEEINPEDIPQTLLDDTYSLGICIVLVLVWICTQQKALWNFAMGRNSQKPSR